MTRQADSHEKAPGLNTEVQRPWRRLDLHCSDSSYIPTHSQRPQPGIQRIPPDTVHASAVELPQQLLDGLH